MYNCITYSRICKGECSMKRIHFALLIGMILLALFALIGCDEECTHTSCIATSAGSGQHTVSCDACDYVVTESCTGGTASCQKGKLCEKCGAEYGEADTDAHAWNAETGKCDVAGCGAECSHNYTASDNQIDDGLHTLTCSICANTKTESCTGGTASCQKGKICTACQVEYTEKDTNAHAWNAQTGECDTEGCIVICQHIGYTTATSIGGAQHEVVCSVCAHETIRGCTGGTATCQKGKVCTACQVEYTAADPNAHNWNATTGECDATGCEAVCSHSYAASDNQIDDGLHALTCNICGHNKTESCTGGKATAQRRAVCTACGAEHGELLPANTKYKYVVVIGVDGGGTFFQNTSTPNIDRIFANGAITYDAITSNPTISAQSWGSLMHGVTPDFHGLSNSIVGSTPYPTDSPYPSFFRVIRENDANAVLASFSHWNPINFGIVEDGIGVHKVGNMTDEALTGEILTYLATANPTTMFVQFDEADGAGHKNGYGTDAHLETITRIDGYIGQIYDAYVEKGIIDETLFIVTADHGGTPSGGHGGWTDAEKYIMLAATGRTVKEGGTIQDAGIRDTAAIVLHALGYTQPETWTARVPGDLFVGVDATARPVYVNTESDRYHETEPTPGKESGKYVTDFIDKELSVYLPFDGNITDQCGNTTSKSGNLYFLEGGYYGGAVQLDDGYVTLSDYVLSNTSFTAAMWIQTRGASGDPVLFSNANWDSGKNQGLTVALVNSECIRLNVGTGSAKYVANGSLPADFKEGWMHVIVAVDRENNQVRFYYDFGAPIMITYEMDDLSFAGILEGLNIGQDGRGLYGKSLPVTMDEFMIFEGAFTADDVDLLFGYYNTPTLDGAENADVIDEASAVAAGAVARLGKNAYFTTLQKAIEAASAEGDNTIIVFADATLSAALVGNKAITFDLDGNTLTVTDFASLTASLTLKNGIAVVSNETYSLAGNASVVIDGDGVTVLAEAKMGTTYYATLQEAIIAANAGNGGTITMLADANYGKVTAGVPISKNITIDGQGKYKITADITTDFYCPAESTTLTLQNLTLTATTVNADGSPRPNANMGVIYLGTVPSAKVYINNCTVTSTNDVALQSTKRSGGGFFVTDSMIFGGRYAIRYNDSDHTLTITNSEVCGGLYSIIAEGDNPRMNATITDSVMSGGIYLKTGEAKVTLAGDTVVNSVPDQTKYPGCEGCGFAVEITTENNALTLMGNAKINGNVNVIAGTFTFDASYEGTQVIRKSGTTYYYFYDDVATAMTAAAAGDTVFTYSSATADAAKAQYTVVEENGYYKIS